MSGFRLGLLDTVPTLPAVRTALTYITTTQIRLGAIVAALGDATLLLHCLMAKTSITGR